MVLINPNKLSLSEAKAVSDAIGLMRPDGRPECYEVPPAPDGAGYVCQICSSQGHHRKYQAGEAFMSSPVDSPDGKAHFVCRAHLPDDIVIYDPVSNKCRDKNGQNVWEEK